MRTLDNMDLIYEKNFSINIVSRCENERINDFFKELLPYEKYISVYLHGSWADNTKTAFSDIDDFIVIDDINISQKDMIKIINILNKMTL